MQTEINYKLLGKRVVAKRTEHNLMQKDLAEKLGIAVNHLSDVERGVKKPSLELLMRISVQLDTPVDYFLMDSPRICRQYLINEELASSLKECTPQALQFICRMVKEMVEFQNSVIPKDE